MKISENQIDTQCLQENKHISTEMVWAQAWKHGRHGKDIVCEVNTKTVVRNFTQLHQKSRRKRHFHENNEKTGVFLGKIRKLGSSD